MWDTSTRLLHLLALMQRSPHRNAAELARELGVTDRTVRRDVARLRTLGYPVTSVGGTGGGYELETGAALPPLVLDASEAVATVLALRRGSSGAEAASALEKIRRVLPDGVRPSVDAVTDHTGHVDLGRPLRPPAGSSSTEVLALLARACRLRRRVTCHYERHTGERGEQLLEPRRLVHALGRWYLLAYSVGSDAWRTYRVDRLTGAVLTSGQARPRADPSDDLDEHVATGLRASMRRVHGAVRVLAPVDAVAPWVSPAWGTVSAEGDGTTRVEAGADSYVAMARWLLLLGAPLVVLEPPELLAAFGEVAAEAALVTGPEPPGPGA